MTAAILFTHDLIQPIELGAEVIATLTFRRINLGDMKAMSKTKDSMDALALLVSRLTGQPIPVIDRLDTEDLQAVMVSLAPFLPAEEEKKPSSGELS